MEILRDPIWQFIGAVLAVLSIAASLYFAARQKGRREIAAGFLIKKHLIRVSDTVADRISLTFDGAPVQNLKIYSYGIKNSGTIEIRPEDYQRPIALHLSEGVRLLEARCDRQSPASLSPTISTTGSTINIAPLLLNPGDFLVIDVFASGESGTITLDQRIAGISKIKRINTGIRFQKHHLRNSFTNSILAIIIGIGMYFAAQASGNRHPEIAAWSAGAMIVMFLLLTSGEWLIGRITNSNNRYIDGI